MPIRRKKQIDGDLYIPGSIQVLGGIQASNYRKTVTRVSTTETEVTAVDGRVTVVEDGVETYINDTIPNANATSLTFVDPVYNSDGSVDVTASWNFTQGTDEATGFMLYVKRAAGADPTAIVLATDPCVYIPAREGVTSYSHKLTLSTRQIQSDESTLPIRYRFGVIACAFRKSGTYFAGAPTIVEAVGWVAKTFACIIQNDEYNYWDLATGIFRCGNATKYVKIDPTTGSIDVSSLDLQLTDSELITTNFDGDTLSHELAAMQWRDADGNDIGRIGLMNDAPNPIVERVFAAVNTGTSVAAGDTMSGSYNNYCSVRQGNKIYVFPSGANPVQIYDIDANTFTDGDTLGNWNRFTAVLYNNKVYLPQDSGTNLEIYDIVSDTINAGATLGNYSRYISQLYNGKIYLFQYGGTNLEIYDIASDTVSAGATLGNWNRVASQLYNGKIYVFQSSGTNLEIYDIAANTVSAGATLGNYSRVVSILHNGKIYLPRNNGTNLEIYDIATDTVSAGVALGNYSRWTGCLYKEKIYLPRNSGTEIEIYDINTNTVSSLAILSNYNRLSSHFYNGKIYLPLSATTALEIVTVGENCALGAGIIERGSNADGSYIKYSDGTMMQSGDATNASLAISTAYLGGFRNTAGSFLFNYAATWYAVPQWYGVPTGNTCFSVMHSTSSESTTQGSAYITAVGTQGAAARSFKWFAFGKWRA